jgi:hypothetical protein
MLGRSAVQRRIIFMGYILQPETLLEESTPAIIRGLQHDDVDVVVLVPV